MQKKKIYIVPLIYSSIFGAKCSHPTTCHHLSLYRSDTEACQAPLRFSWSIGCRSSGTWTWKTRCFPDFYSQLPIHVTWRSSQEFAGRRKEQQVKEIHLTFRLILHVVYHCFMVQAGPTSIKLLRMCVLMYDDWLGHMTAQTLFWLKIETGLISARFQWNCVWLLSLACVYVLGLYLWRILEWECWSEASLLIKLWWSLHCHVTWPIIQDQLF